MESEDYTVDHEDSRGLIEYTRENVEVFIGYTDVEESDNVISFWKGGFYQGSVQTETNRLFYGNDEVDFSVDVSQKFIEKVQSEVIE